MDELGKAMKKDDHLKVSEPEQEGATTASDPLAKQKADLEDFYSYLPTHQYIYRPTGDLWPASSVNGRLPMVTTSDGKVVKPSEWLDQKRAVHQMVWDPKEEPVIYDRVMQASAYIPHQNANIVNLYRPPKVGLGDPDNAEPWIDHLRKIYPDDAQHIENYLAYKIQNPGEKINHALILGGSQGIGKDSILEPIKAGVGPWNWKEISPSQMVGRFNGWAKCVMLRISEARDLGDANGLAFYEQSKALLAAPPDVIRVDEKNMREHDVVNVCGVIITTNHKSDGLFLPPDDRRHYVAWSEALREQFDEDYWTSLYRWFAGGGTEHVVAYLARKDLSAFDAKAPPPKTPAFWEMAQANDFSESGELRDLIDFLKYPSALTLTSLASAAADRAMIGLVSEISDKKFRKKWGNRLSREGYERCHNPESTDGLFTVKKKRQAVYVKRSLSSEDRLKAAQSVS